VPFTGFCEFSHKTGQKSVDTPLEKIADINRKLD